MPEHPTVTIVHELPGRVRMRLSPAPKASARLEESIGGHEGIVSVAYTPVTRSILVQFAPGKVSREEIAVRAAVGLSLDSGGGPVRVLTQPEARDMSDSAFYSGLLLGASLLQRLVRGGDEGRRLLDWAAGIATTGAIAEHGYNDMQRHGSVDPEVLSVVYLLAAFLRRNVLPAAVFAWATTFGRHILSAPDAGVLINPVEVPADNDERSRYEIVVSQRAAQQGPVTLLRLLPAVFMSALTGGGGTGPAALLTDIDRMSRVHGQVLEGLGDTGPRIPLRLGQRNAGATTFD